jgi:cell division protein FtsA
VRSWVVRTSSANSKCSAWARPNPKVLLKVLSSTSTRPFRQLRKAIKEASDQSGIDIGVVNVGIAGQHIRSFVQHGGITRSSKEDEITIADVERLTQDMYRMVVPPGSQIIHVMPQDYMVDYEEGIKEPVGMSGVRLEADFHIITAQTNAINNINKCIEEVVLKQKI